MRRCLISTISGESYPLKNNPLVSALKQGKKNPVPFTHISTIATTITTGNPPSGEEILHKAYQYNWLAEEASEIEKFLRQ